MSKKNKTEWHMRRWLSFTVDIDLEDLSLDYRFVDTITLVTNVEPQDFDFSQFEITNYGHRFKVDHPQIKDAKTSYYYDKKQDTKTALDRFKKALKEIEAEVKNG